MQVFGVCEELDGCLEGQQAMTALRECVCCGYDTQDTLMKLKT